MTTSQDAVELEQSLTDISRLFTIHLARTHRIQLADTCYWKKKNKRPCNERFPSLLGVTQALRLRIYTVTIHRSTVYIYTSELYDP